MSIPTQTATAYTGLELALCDRVADLGYTLVRPSEDLQSLVTAHGSVIRVRRTGGLEDTWQVVARIVVEVYAATYDTVWRTAEAVAGRLLASPYRAGGMRIDRVVNESANAEAPHPNLRVVQAIYRASTRDL